MMKIGFFFENISLQENLLGICRLSSNSKTKLVVLRKYVTFLEQKKKLSSVAAKIWAMVPKRWNNMAVNWMTKMRAKKKTNTRPMGSNWRYSLVMCTCNSHSVNCRKVVIFQFKMFHWSFHVPLSSLNFQKFSLFFLVNIHLLYF